MKHVSFATNAELVFTISQQMDVVVSDAQILVLPGRYFSLPPPPHTHCLQYCEVGFLPMYCVCVVEMNERTHVLTSELECMFTPDF